MVNPAIVAAFDPSKSTDPMVVEAGLRDAVRRVKLAYHKHQYEKHANRQANAHAKTLSHAAKRMSVVDFHHYIKGNHDKMSAKGKKVLNSKRFKKLDARSDVHGERAKKHLDAAMEHHSYLQGHGRKKSEAFAHAMYSKHQHNLRTTVANRLNRSLSKSGKTPRKNLKSATKDLHKAATAFHDNAKAWEKQGKLKGKDKHFLHSVKQEYKTPKAPKVDSKSKPPRSPGNPPSPNPRNGVEKENQQSRKKDKMNPNIIAAFKNTTPSDKIVASLIVKDDIDPKDAGYYEVDASLKDSFRKAQLFGKKVGGKLRKKLAAFHTHEVHRHEGHKANAQPGTGKHLFHDTMSKFHRSRLSNILNKHPAPIHKTVKPSDIPIQHNKKTGEAKPAASRAEQAAHQHHMEEANATAHAHNELKEKGFHRAAENVAKAHDESKEAAKSISKRRSVPKTEEVKLKGRGKYVRTDAHKQAIRDGKAKAKAAREAAKEAEEKEAKKKERAAKRASKKTETKDVKEEKPKATRTRKKVEPKEDVKATPKRVTRKKSAPPAEETKLKTRKTPAKKTEDKPKTTRTRKKVEPKEDTKPAPKKKTATKKAPAKKAPVKRARKKAE